MELTQSSLVLWKQPGQSPIFQYEIGPLKNLVYLVIDWKTKLALWVDPQRDLSEPVKDLESFGLKLQGILLTHTHPDHIAGLPALRELYPEIPVYLHGLDAHRLRDITSAKSLHFLEDHDDFLLGTLKIQAIHTPGHSAGALTYQTEDCLLTGDTLFIRDCGRTDLPTGSTFQMFQTLQRYKTMNPQLKIFPGHHYRPEFWSTLAEETRSSPPLQCRSVQELEILP